VAALGHGNPQVMRAIASSPVAHALGDLAEAVRRAEPSDRLPRRRGRSYISATPPLTVTDDELNGAFGRLRRQPA